jgi:hypothetical protein
VVGFTFQLVNSVANSRCLQLPVDQTLTPIGDEADAATSEVCDPTATVGDDQKLKVVPVATKKGRKANLYQVSMHTARVHAYCQGKGKGEGG